MSSSRIARNSLSENITWEIDNRLEGTKKPLATTLFKREK